MQQTNEELEEKAELLARQNVEVEQKNRQIEQARLAVEEKAEQLALTSKYKSEFLANMSHELRTPLNSLLILSKLLATNDEHNLTDKQVEFARTIHSSGADLLELINEILDLAKIESGTMDVDARPVVFTELEDYVERTFREVAAAKGLTFTTTVASDAPPSDGNRCQAPAAGAQEPAVQRHQVHRERLGVARSIEPAAAGWSTDHAHAQRGARA